MENLDCLERVELMKFWRDYAGATNAARLFPNKQSGYKRATADLANYAANKATAMLCRERGEVESAQTYEGICDRIYRNLPDFAKW